MSKDNYMKVVSIDGRKKRSKDTSELILDTALSLLNEGILNITHELIAKEAKIGIKLFSYLSSLLFCSMPSTNL